MFYVSSINGNSVGVMDTYDNVEEFYSPNQIKEISEQINIMGVSSKGIKKIDLDEALLTVEIIEKIDCKKELSFEVVDNFKLAKYKLLGGKLISDNFMTIETNTNIKLVSTKIIMLDNSILVIVNTSTTRKEWKGLFEKTKFTKIDFHNTNTSKIENMNSIFKNCHATFIDLSSFDTSNVRYMNNMFRNCHATSLDLSSFNTSNVERMGSMFSGCHAISLDLSSFDTFNVKNMGFMFKGCHTKSLDLSSFNTSSVEDMGFMFKDCQATSLNLSSFDTSNVEAMDFMFERYRGTVKSTDIRLLQVYNSRR